MDGKNRRGAQHLRHHIRNEETISARFRAGDLDKHYTTEIALLAIECEHREEQHCIGKGK